MRYKAVQTVKVFPVNKVVFRLLFVLFGPDSAMVYKAVTPKRQGILPDKSYAGSHQKSAVSYVILGQLLTGTFEKIHLNLT